MTLEQIAANHPTDKLSVHSYLPFYERLFSSLRNTENPVLEIGVDGGGSLCIWEEWFNRAAVRGADINICPPYIAGRKRITHYQCDAYSDDGVRAINHSGYFSVAIDDGPHSIESQRWFCSVYPLLLSSEGIAIVEDIQDINQAPSLASALPEGFNHATIDLRTVKGRYDDVLFLAWRK